MFFCWSKMVKKFFNNQHRKHYKERKDIKNIKFNQTINFQLMKLTITYDLIDRSSFKSTTNTGIVTSGSLSDKTRETFS